MAKTPYKHNPEVARPIEAKKSPAHIDPKTQPAPAVQDNPFKVRATQVGYYDHVRRREGDVFICANEQAFSDKWMERVDARTRERVTSAPQALQRAHDDILGGTVSRVDGGTPDDVFGDE